LLSVLLLGQKINSLNINKAAFFLFMQIYHWSSRRKAFCYWRIFGMSVKLCILKVVGDGDSSLQREVRAQGGFSQFQHYMWQLPNALEEV